MSTPDGQPRPKRRRRQPGPAPAPAPEVVVVPRLSAATRLKRWLCRLVVSAFGWTYLFVLALQVLATYDPFNLVPKPLVGVSLIVLGLPWTLGSSSFPEGLQYLAAAVAPAINWLILGFLCAWQRLKSHGPKGEPGDER
jgi:hypothetical protein